LFWSLFGPLLLVLSWWCLAESHIMEGKSVIAMSQGYVILGGVYIALTSYSMYIHFVYPSMNLLRFMDISIFWDEVSAWQYARLLEDACMLLEIASRPLHVEPVVECIIITFQMMCWTIFCIVCFISFWTVGQSPAHQEDTWVWPWYDQWCAVNQVIGNRNSLMR
jgi:hypothetical protein